MHNSLNTHGVLTESSLTTPIGKGREGKGREVGHPSIVSTGGARARRAAATAAVAGRGDVMDGRYAAHIERGHQ